jgi:hypothetical protein
VPGISGFRAFGCEAYGAAVAVAGSFAVDGFCNREYSGFGSIETSTFVVHKPGLVAKCAQYGVIENFRFGNVVGADHDVTEHCLFS